MKSTITPIHAWEHWRSAWHTLYYGLLVSVTLLSLRNLPIGSMWWVIIGVVALIALGYWWVIIRRPDAVRSADWLAIVYFAATLIGSVVLVAYYPFFLIFAWSLIAHIFRYFPLRLAFVNFGVLVVTLTLEMAWLAGWSLFNPILLIVVAYSSGLAIALALWIDRIIDQSRRRQQLIEELEATRQELVRAEREAGILEERSRLAREIHDSLAQGFTSIVLHLEAADALLPHEATTIQRHLYQARQAARDGLNEARRVVWALRPELLERVTLPEAITHTVEQWSHNSGIQATAHITGIPRILRTEIDITLLRAAQEALSNVRKHAQATHVIVTLSYIGNGVSLDVQDNGRGTDLLAMPEDGSGFGLHAMRERVAQCGGTLIIESAPGEGTTLVIEIPQRTGDTG